MLTKIITGAAHRGLAGRSRLTPLICSLLVFWTGIDSQFFMLIGAGTLPPPVSSAPSCLDDLDDDEMIGLTATRTPFQANRKKDPPSLPHNLRKGIFSELSSCQLSPFPASTEELGGYDRQDDFDTPLRC
jgi:hypothetical protein